MSTNNTALYDAVVAGVILSNYSWIISTNSADYNQNTIVAAAIATEVDSLIPPITGGATISQRDLISSIATKVFLTRFQTDNNPNDYSGIAQAIVALFTSASSVLQNTTTGNPLPAPFVYYLDSVVDSTGIPNYLQLTPLTSYSANTQQMAT